MSILRTSVVTKLRVYNSKQTDVRILPVTSLTQSFAVNEIPQCHVQIGLGLDVRDSQLRNVIDDAAREFIREDNLCQLICWFEGDFSATEKWNEEPTVIFEGKIKNIADQITRGAAALNLSITSWLADLQGQPLLYQYAYPGANQSPTDDTAANYGFGSFDNANSRGSGAVPVGAIGQLVDSRFLDTNNVTNDIWGNGIKEMFAQLATNPLKHVLSRSNCKEAVNFVPDKVKTAIERLQGPTSILGSPYTSGNGPLLIADLDVNGQPTDIEAYIRRTIAEAITHQPFDAFLNEDAWSKMINTYSPMFGCTLIPRVQDAMFTPHMPALSIAYCKTISANDIVQLDTLEPISKPVKAIGVQSGARSLWGRSEVMGTPEIAEAIACFSPEGVRNNGKTLVIPPPVYMAGLAYQQDIAHLAINVKQIAGGVAAPGQVARPPRDTTGVAGILNRYAKSVYYQRRIGGKSLKIVGKLRFDIAPGSVVRVSAQPDQIVGSGVAATEFQGYVNRVTIVIDVTRKTAATIFQLSHNRTMRDNDDPSVTTDRHPIFANRFTGCPLIDSLTNNPCS